MRGVVMVGSSGQHWGGNISIMFVVVPVIVVELADFEHWCSGRKDVDDSVTQDCRCWSMGCYWEDNCSVPHNLLALDLQKNTKDKCQ